MSAAKEVKPVWMSGRRDAMLRAFEKHWHGPPSSQIPYDYDLGVVATHTLFWLSLGWSGRCTKDRSEEHADVSYYRGYFDARIDVYGVTCSDDDALQFHDIREATRGAQKEVYRRMQDVFYEKGYAKVREKYGAGNVYRTCPGGIAIRGVIPVADVIELYESAITAKYACRVRHGHGSVPTDHFPFSGNSTEAARFGAWLKRGL